MVDTETGSAKSRRRDRGPAPFAFTFRCPADLIGLVNEARFVLREPSRTSLMRKALEEYLNRRGITREGIREPAR